jgi:hypothetical protein
MGTTLTGTTPQDTYDSLIKVTDNGPLSGTLKKLTDGLGNDSSLSLSTTAASLSGTLAVTGNATLTSNGVSVRLGSATANAGANILIAGASSNKNWSIGVQQNISGGLEFTPTATNGGLTLGTTPAMVVLDNGNVGIGTSTPVARLDAVAAETGTYTTSTQQVVERIYNSPPDLGSGVNSAFLSLQTTTDGGNANPTARIGVVAESYGSNNGAFVVTTREAAGNIEKMRITSDGYLRLATGGIQFNGDTAAANALDDYEEGTFTPVPVGWTTNPTALAGKYTKIGALVSIKVAFSGGVKVSATSAYFTGLPFAGAEAGGGTVSGTSVEDAGIMLLDNSDRIWFTQSNFVGISAKGTGSYMLV